jgi:acid stress-induced BolA-like protein IbaG/YrbA
MNPQQVAQMIRTGVPGCVATVESGDNVHFDAVVVAAAFAGKRPLQRHQLVYAALGAAMGNEIHALAIKAYTPEEYEAQARG